MPWEKKGSGCDKAFYWDGTDADGWLNFNSRAVMEAELAARGKLLNVNKVIPAVDQARAKPTLADGTTALGYYIQRVNLSMTIKPQMNKIEVLKRVKKELLSVTGDDKITTLKSSLQFILDNCDVICSEVGELTIGIDRESGKAYLLDLAKTNGQAGGTEQAQKAKIGLGKMITFLG